jgi:hypothetical protein
MNKNIIYISYLNISHELNKKIPLLTTMKSFAKIYIKLKYFIIYVIDLWDIMIYIWIIWIWIISFLIDDLNIEWNAKYHLKFQNFVKYLLEIVKRQSNTSFVS